MRSEKVIVSNFLIERKNQLKSFEIKISINALRITGVQLQARLVQMKPFEPRMLTGEIPLTANRNNVIGELRLRSNDSTNVFYSEDLVLDNKNTNFGGFASFNFFATEFNRLPKSEICPVHVDARSTTIKGIYKDKTVMIKHSDIAPDFLRYQISVHLRLEIRKRDKVK